MVTILILPCPLERTPKFIIYPIMEYGHPFFEFPNIYCNLQDRCPYSILVPKKGGILFKSRLTLYLNTLNVIT